MGAKKQATVVTEAFQTYKVSYKLNLISEEAAQVLYIDSQLPIDYLIL